MMKKWATMCILAGMIIGMVLLSGCTSSQPTAKATVTAASSSVTAAPTTIQPPSDRNIIQQGIADAEKACIDQLPRAAPTDKCVLTSENKEKMINVIIQNITEIEQHCQTTLPRSKDLNVCKITDTKKRLISGLTTLCMQGREPVTSQMSYCLYIQIYHRHWYDDYSLN